MALTTNERQAIQDRLADLCEEAKQAVKGGAQYKATILLRAPHLPDGDVLVTEDDLSAVQRALERASGRDESVWNGKGKDGRT